MKLIHSLKSSVLVLLVFLFPLFFLTTTQEFFITNKLYLLVFGALALLLLSTVEFGLTKKLGWKRVPFDSLVVLFLIAVGISVVISSINKIQAALNPNFGLVALAALAVLYFYLSRAHLSRHLSSMIYHLSSILLSLVTIIFFFQPLKNTNLPSFLQFLKNPSFTPLGSQIDLAIVLGLALTIQITRILTRKHTEHTEKRSAKSVFPSVVSVFFLLIALFLTLYSILKPTTNNQSLITILPPFRLSWYAAVEILKNPLTAFFGVGVDNFSVMFSRVKDVLYNQSPLWQVGTFSISRSALLHVFTETGIVGFAAFILLLVAALREAANVDGAMKFAFFYLLAVLVLFPPSLVVFFLLFVLLGLLSHQPPTTNHQPLTTDHQSPTASLNLSHIIPLYSGTLVVAVLAIAGLAYLAGRSYAAEYYLKKSLDGFAANNAKTLYDNQRQAVLMNPYIERLRVNFSQVNLLIANNIASARQSPTGEGGQPTTNDQQPTNQLSEQDRQNIATAIQAAIAEAKAAVTLNPLKAGNWENLAAIYRNVLSVAQGADTWTISSYQRAIVQDPGNPLTRLNLGGLYYNLQNYDEAVRFFEQAIDLKPDWANAYYNLAWASYQKSDFRKAVNAMQNVLTLLDPKTAKQDYDKANKDLTEFKKKLPAEEQQATGAAQQQPQSQLNLPTVAPTLAPKIELPNSASPEAQ